MNWTKIPTNLIVEHTPDKDILAIVKYQLLWAALEHRPDDRTALRHMSANQLRIACQYIDSISGNISLDINSCNNHRSRQKLYYAKIRGVEQKTDGHTDGHADGHNDTHTDGHADGIDKIRLDKIRKEKEISDDISKKKFTADSEIGVNGQDFNEFPAECMPLLREYWTDEKIESIRKDLAAMYPHKTTVRRLLEKYPENKSKPQKTEKKAYGEQQKVKLTDEEYAKLQELYGDKLNAAIEKLDVYLASYNKKYASHYAVMRRGNWVYKEIFKGIQQTEQVDFSEITRLWNEMATRLKLDKIEESDLMPERKTEIEKIIAIKKPKELKSMFDQLEKTILRSPKLLGRQDVLGSDGHWITKELNWKANFAFCFSTKGWSDIMGGKYNGEVE